MCGKVERRSRSISPGSSLFIKTDSKGGNRLATWGFSEGMIYNARSEKLDGAWKKYADNRCVVEVDAFYEGGKKFKSSSGKFYLAGLFNNKDEVVLLTQPANDSVKKYHHRMPILITDLNTYFK